MQKLLAENAELRARLAEAEDTLSAIRSGAVDALLVDGKNGLKVFTLKGADQTYRILVETMNEGAITISEDGIVLFCNQRFSFLVDLPIHKILGAKFEQFLPPAEHKKFKQFLKQIRRSAKRQELRIQSAEGESRFVHVSGSRLGIDEINGFCLVVTDITERKNAELALSKSEERFQIVSRRTSDGIWDWNLVTNEVFWSETAFELFRYSKTCKISLSWWLDKIHNEDRAAVLKKLRKFRPSRETHLSYSYRFHRGDGSIAYVHDRSSGIRNGKGQLVRMVGAMADVTEQRQAEFAQREISQRILEAQEQERRRVARELHDSVNQILSATRFHLHSLERNIGAPNHEVLTKTANVKQLIEKAINEVRTISKNLHPSELEDIGLLAAIRATLHEFQERTNVTSVFHEPKRWKRIDSQTRLTIFRIVQEALNNVERHSEATQVDVILHQRSSGINLVVRDNGKGFQPSSARQRKGLGLDNIRERASFIGGVVKVNSVLRQGTEISVQIPLPNER